MCESGACVLSGTVLPCTEQGIRNAIAAGEGPYTFDCVGPTTVTTEAPIVIDNDVILDGDGNLVVDGDLDHRVFSVQEGVTAELIEFQLTRGRGPAGLGGGISNAGSLTLTASTVFANASSGMDNSGTATVTNCVFTDNAGPGLVNEFDATMILTDSTVSGNVSRDGIGRAGGIWTDGILISTGNTISDNAAELEGGGIYNSGDLTLINSTVSGNSAGESGGGIHCDDSTDGLTLVNSTVVGNSAPEGSVLYSEAVTPVTFANSVLQGTCAGPSDLTSNGYNIESPSDTCSLDQVTDQVDATTEQLSLGPLADNGGPTETHSLLPGSIAIDVIPAAACQASEDEPLVTDQRGQPRPEAGGSMCDVGAFELQP